MLVDLAPISHGHCNYYTPDVQLNAAVLEMHWADNNPIERRVNFEVGAYNHGHDAR
jgi:hypothetical protein